MRRYILALCAAVVLVLGAYVINTGGGNIGGGQIAPSPQPRILPNTSGFSLR